MLQIQGFLQLQTHFPLESPNTGPLATLRLRLCHSHLILHIQIHYHVELLELQLVLLVSRLGLIFHSPRPQEVTGRSIEEKVELN